MTRRKDNLWQEVVTYIDNTGHKRQKYFYGKSKAAVNRKIAEWNESHEKQKSPPFTDIADDWWETTEPNIAENTKKGYRPALRRAKEYFGTKPIDEIRPVDINAFITSFVKDNHVADKTARTQLGVVNMIFKHGVACGAVESNPARDLDVPKHLSHSKREMPSECDIRAVKASVDKPFGLFAYMAMYTGCRRNELLALTWDDINLEERTITINKSLYQVNGHIHVKLPKSEKGIRTLPIMDALLPHLRPSEGLVFKNPTTGGYIHDGTFTLLWERYKAVSGVTCTPHQLRHCYATMLFEAGVSESDAQELLGHAQISTTKDVYTHIRESRKKAVRESLFAVDIN